jgi:integrase/recombinase XerD
MSAGQLHHREVDPHIAVNPIKPIPERYIEYLMARGYALRTRRNYVDAVEQFTRWLGRRRINRSAVQQFLQQSSQTHRRSAPAVRDPRRDRAALRHLLEMLGHSPVQSPFPEGYGGRLLRRYAQRLTTARGLAASSVRIHVTCIRAMLRRLRVGRRCRFAKWTPELIQRYVSRAGRRSPRFGQKVAGCVRSFVRFLLEEGLIRRDLAAAVPSFARWRLASLPETLRKEEVERLVRAADLQTSLGRRDQAIVLCLSELGLRASDVAGLELDGIDFTARVLRLRRRKEREITALPIPRRMAAALKTYIRDGRPACASSAVFVRHYAPVGKPITPMNVCNVVLRLAARAGLRDRVGGTHVLRHSLASRMLGAGATLKQIADLLGHTTVDTTSIYAKVDLRTLSRVALPWPGSKGVRQ